MLLAGSDRAMSAAAGGTPQLNSNTHIGKPMSHHLLGPARAPPSTLTAAACRLVAAAVEGLDQVFVLECHPVEGRLQLQQEVHLAGMQLPSSLQADSAGRLWVAGMPGDVGAPAACLARAKCSGGKLQVSLCRQPGSVGWRPSGRLGQLPCL